MGSGITLSQKLPGKAFIVSLKKTQLFIFKKPNNYDIILSYLCLEINNYNYLIINNISWIKHEQHLSLFFQ